MRKAQTQSVASRYKSQPWSTPLRSPPKDTDTPASLNVRDAPRGARPHRTSLAARVYANSQSDPKIQAKVSRGPFFKNHRAPAVRH